MALVTFPSCTNQQLFISFLDNNNVVEYEDRDCDVWVQDDVLDHNDNYVSYVFSLGGYITGKIGFG